MSAASKVFRLSKGNYVRCFYRLSDTVVDVFEDTDTLLSDELIDISHDIAFLSEYL